MVHNAFHMYVGFPENCGMCLQAFEVMLTHKLKLTVTFSLYVFHGVMVRAQQRSFAYAEKQWVSRGTNKRFRMMLHAGKNNAHEIK